MGNALFRESDQVLRGIIAENSIDASRHPDWKDFLRRDGAGQKKRSVSFDSKIAPLERSAAMAGRRAL